jgi:membrane protease YdiL (CAAX protease family)
MNIIKMKSKRFAKQNSIIIYFLLAFSFSWGLVGILAGPGNIPINPEKSQELLPLLYLSMLVGPSFAGVLMIGLIEGKNGYRRLLSGFLKWRVKIWWYIFALFTTPFLALMILLILSFLNPNFQFGFSNSDNIAALFINGIIAGIVVGIFEEVGWTGFVIPRLNLRYNIITTGLIVGVLWGLWHFILFWENDSFFKLLPLLILLGRLFAWLPPFRIVMVWVYNSTKSLLLTVLTHASLVFTTTVIVPITLTGKDLLIWLIIWAGVLWIMTLIILRIIRKKKSMNDERIIATG